MLQRWVQTAAIQTVPRTNSKITRYTKVSNSNEIHNTVTNLEKIPSPSTMEPNKIKYGKERKYDEQKGNISSEGGTPVDIRLDPNWAKNLLVWQRLFAHHTLSSIRKSVIFTCHNAPRDKLDFVLDSIYRHEAAVFPEITDVYLQPETVGQETW
jgi:hypothetical protein